MEVAKELRRLIEAGMTLAELAATDHTHNLLVLPFLRKDDAYAVQAHASGTSGAYIRGLCGATALQTV